MNNRAGIYVRVSTDDQKDNGYSIDSQLRMIKEYCEKNDYIVIDVYNDAGHSGKDLMRPEMQRLLKDIKSKKIDKLVAIKVDRLTRNNFDGFWLLNYCEQNDVKIELILEPYDVSTANGEMIFGMNLVFGQRERKEISARTKRALEEMALEHVHPNKAPYGYIRNKESGHLEIEPIESLIVKQIFELYKDGKSIRDIVNYLKDNNAYLLRGKWTSDRVYKILTNEIYIGIFAYGKYRRKKQDILYVNNYCEPIISEGIWNTTRVKLEKNKHPNYGNYIHLFSSMIKCPDCNKILSSTLSFKNKGKSNEKIYYHLTCKNPNCKSKGIHYNTEKIEKKLYKVLNELTRYMYDIDNEILTSSTNKTKEIKEIDKAIEKLKLQEKRLVDLYISSSLDVEAINTKNESIKKEIDKLLNKRNSIDPEDDYKDYTVELLNVLDCKKDKYCILFKDKTVFSCIWDNLNRRGKKILISKLISSIEISRDKDYNINIEHIKFSDEFISKCSKGYIKYLYDILTDNKIGVTYKEQINSEQLKILMEDYIVVSLQKLQNNEYSKTDIEHYKKLMEAKLYYDGIIYCHYSNEERIIDHLILIPKFNLENLIKEK